MTHTVSIDLNDLTVGDRLDIHRNPQHPAWKVRPDPAARTGRLLVVDEDLKTFICTTTITDVSPDYLTTPGGKRYIRTTGRETKGGRTLALRYGANPPR